MTTENHRKVFRDNIQEHRGNYFVTYHPADGDNWLATANLSFPEFNSNVAEVKHAIEREFAHWLARFAVPVMVTAFDAKDSVIRLSRNPYESHLTGYVDPQSGQLVQRWGIFENEEFPSEQKDAGYLERVYQDIPFRLQAEVREKARRKARITGRAMRIFVFFVVGTPVLIEIAAQGVAWVGHILATISITVGLFKLGKTMGWLKPFKRDQEKLEVQRRKDHYFYHCERNPEAFSRLKCENFERETIERTRKESEEIRKRQQK